MTIANCPTCDGTHFGSHDCPFLAEIASLRAQIAALREALEAAKLALEYASPDEIEEAVATIDAALKDKPKI